jgi:PAS domain S-box-containing protein
MESEHHIELPPNIAADGLSSLLIAIVNSSDDAIISKTLDGIVTSWNPAAEAMFGYTAAEVVGQSIRIIIPSDRQEEEDFVLGKIRCGERVDHFETIRQTKHGELLNISLTVSPVRNSSGTVIGVSKIARDITVRKRMEREREELLARERQIREQLADALASRDEFIAVAAHELRNPLNVINLSFQILQRLAGDPSASDKMQRFILKCQNQLRHMASLIDRLLDVTKIRTGTFELVRAPIDLGSLLRDVVARFASDSTPISLQAPARIDGVFDRMRIDQALTNLLSNAVRYGAGKPIEIVATTSEGEITIAVKDQGPGIPEDDRKRIFERFERGHEHTSGIGLGLGLWITQRIAEAHGGTLRVESEVGRGSTFTLALPLQSQ